MCWSQVCQRRLELSSRAHFRRPVFTSFFLGQLINICRGATATGTKKERKEMIKQTGWENERNADCWNMLCVWFIRFNGKQFTKLIQPNRITYFTWILVSADEAINKWMRAAHHRHPMQAQILTFHSVLYHKLRCPITRFEQSHLDSTKCT